MHLLKKIPFFLFLLILFFCLHGSVENYSYLNLKEVTVVALEISAGITVLFLIILFFSKNYIFSSLVSFFISLWYLFFGSIHDWIKSKHFLSFIQSYSVLVPLIIIGTFIGVVFLKRNKQLYPKTVLYLNLLLLIYCLFDGFLLLNKYRHDNKTLPVYTVAFDESKVAQKPNVYFLMFDEYAGYKSLQDSFGFKNDSLYNFLQQHEFKILPTFSNYDYTAFSMSSILNMHYIDSNYDHQLLTRSDIQKRLNEIKNGAVFNIFKSMNYTIENYSVFDIEDYPRVAKSQTFFPTLYVLLTDKIFHNRIFKDLGWWLMIGKFQISFIKKKYIFRRDADNKSAEEIIINSAAEKKGVPKFHYAHFLLPHGVYYRDSSGKYNSHRQMLDMFNKPVYLSYLKYTNTVIRSLVKKITINDPRAVIIIMSDHGFRYWGSKLDNDPFNYDNICLVRFPDKNFKPYKDRWSTVNFFRYIFNCAYGQNIPYLADSSIVLRY